jgi:hypothetical protein
MICFCEIFLLTSVQPIATFAFSIFRPPLSACYPEPACAVLSTFMNFSLPPAPLLADTGVPMIFLAFPAMVILLIPIIVVEGLLCKKWLGLTMWQAMKSNAASNLASTLVGVPFAWAIMLSVDYAATGMVSWGYTSQGWDSPIANAISLLLGSTWIGPPENGLWIVPAATLVLLVPFFFASYGIEYLVVKAMVGKPEGGPPNLAYPRVRIAVRNANLVTYGAMFLATSVWLITQLHGR